MASLEQLLKDFPKAHNYLKQIEVEEQNWRASRKNLSELLTIGEAAARELAGIDDKLANAQRALDDLKGQHAARVADLDHEYKEREKTLTDKLESLKVKVSEAEANAINKVKEADRTVVDATSRAATAEEKARQAEVKAQAAEKELDNVKKRHEEFVKSITGGK